MSEFPSAILALDASTEACTVALEMGESRWSRFIVTPRGHARELLDMVEAVLVEAGLARHQIGLLAYGRGPGAFTGVRISVGVAQGLAWGLNIPVAGVSTLALVAQGAWRRHKPERVLVAMDARMNEVYWAGCAFDPDSGLMLPVGDEAVAAAAEVHLPQGWQDYVGIGTAWETYENAMVAAIARAPITVDPAALPNALDLLPFGRHARDTGRTIPADQASPIYLRNRVTG